MNPPRTYSDADFVVGKSRQMRDVFHQMEIVSGGMRNVLITGDSGTGKEQTARYIHRHSARHEGPFVPVNCGAIPKELFESELFGHVKGAFTGAVSDTKGLFRAADGGTIFLDEVTEIPPDIQVKLLRVLQDKYIRPLGATNEIEVDVRVIAATNRNLDQESERRALRDDFFYRLNATTIHLSPLRQRREDIPDLVAFFVDRLNQRHKDAQKEIDQSVIERLSTYSWPGNVRELQHVVENAYALAKTNRIVTVDLTETGRRTHRLTRAAEVHYDLIPRQDEWFAPMLTPDLEKRIEIAAQSTGGVLIYGEEGSGSRFLAREIHRLSALADGPFIAVMCDAIPPNQFEQELFGAGMRREIDRQTTRGYIQEAEHGTLYLREFVALPRAIQVMLLALGDESIMLPTSSHVERPRMKTRLIAYTSENLDDALADGRLAVPFYGRLSAFSIYTPPVREQKSRIPEFVDHFIQMFGRKFDRQTSMISEEALACSTAYPWPGNLLEMAFAIQGAMMAANFGIIRKTHLPDRIRLYRAPESDAANQVTIRDMEQTLLENALQEAGGNKVRAAQILGVSRNRLYRMLQKKPLK